jgi:pantetheine-phosphate adenylyltransferase
VAFVEQAVADLPGVSVAAFDGLVVEAARRHGARALVRGVRGFQDWDFEMQMAFANREMHPELDTVFLPPSPGMTNVSSSLVREVAALGGDVSAWVPPHVAAALRG